MPEALVFVLLSFGTFRLWRLLGRDDITSWLWSRIPGKLGEGWCCPWCLGTWLSIAVTYGVDRYVISLEVSPLLWAGAVAATVGFLGDIDSRLSQ